MIVNKVTFRTQQTIVAIQDTISVTQKFSVEGKIRKFKSNLKSSKFKFENLRRKKFIENSKDLRKKESVKNQECVRRSLTNDIIGDGGSTRSKGEDI